MNNRIISILFLLVLFVSGNSCSNVKKPEVLISEEIMTTILIDLYIADGLLNIPVIRKTFSTNDSTINYMMVVEKHGFKLDEFNRNLEYYFTSEPKKFEMIYDDVLSNLSELETESVQARAKTNPMNKNLWNSKPTYRMPDDGTANPVEFSIETEGLGRYKVRARLTIFEDDQSVDPKATIYFWYDDGTEEGHMEMWDSEVYQKSSRSQVLEYEHELSDTLVTHIKGRLIDYKAQAGHWEMHSSLSGINLTFSPVEKKETSDNSE